MVGLPMAQFGTDKYAHVCLRKRRNLCNTLQKALAFRVLKPRKNKVAYGCVSLRDVSLSLSRKTDRNLGYVLSILGVPYDVELGYIYTRNL